MKVGQKMIGQKYYGVMNRPLLNFSKVVLAEYEENQKMNGHSLVFQPQLNTAQAAYFGVVFHEKGWDRLYHFMDQQLELLMLKYCANILYLQ